MWQVILVVSVLLILVFGWIYYNYFSSNSESKSKDKGTKEAKKKAKKTKGVAKSVYDKTHELFCKDEMTLKKFMELAEGCSDTDYINIKSIYDLRKADNMKPESVTEKDYAMALNVTQ